VWATVIAIVALMRTSLASSRLRASRTPTTEQGLTVGELVLIVLVILVAVGGAWLFLGSQSSQQPNPSDEATVQPPALNRAP